VFQAADFLRYEATEQQLVDRVMNLHPRVLNQAALLDRPRSLKDLQCLVAVIEEKCSMAQERQQVGRETPLGNDAAVGPREVSRVQSRETGVLTCAPVKCWSCERPVHIRSCPRNVAI